MTKTNIVELLSHHFHDQLIDLLEERDNGYETKIVLDVTFKFPSNISGQKSLSETESVENLYRRFELFYNSLCCHTICRRHHLRSDDMKPTVWTFLEYSNHKYANKLGNLTDPHFHTVWLLEKSNVGKFYSLIEKFEERNDSPFATIHARTIEFQKYFTGNIQQIFNYNAKFQRILFNEPEIADSMRRYPMKKNVNNLMVCIDEDAFIN